MKHTALLSIVTGVWLAIMPSKARADGEVPIALPAELGKDQVLDHSGKRVRIPDGTRVRLRNQARLVIRADAIVIGKDVYVDGRGELGTPGAPAPARTDEWNSGGTANRHEDWVTSGTEVDRGAPGAPGSPGQPGATLEFQAQRIEGKENLRYEMDGGLGGEGGDGGRGRPLRCGEHQGELKFGPTGFKGPPGPRGASGQVVFSNQPEPLPRAVALTISGGISLGTYEAGYNWALVRHIKARRPGMRQPGEPPPLHLVATTGASAGSINTILTALAWCQTDTADASETATSNIFYQTWAPIGLQELVPEKRTGYDPVKGTGYYPEDAVLSRSAFQKVQRRVIEEVSDNVRFRDDCSLQVGMNVTRQEPELISGSSLEVPMDRYAVALEARSGPTGLTFHDARQKDESAFIKSYLHLTPNAGEVEPETLMQVLTASSAFPVAFGLQQLEYYEYKGESAGAAVYVKKQAQFWDGGLYDNLPVSLALSFLQKPLFGRAPPAAGYSLHAIDPDRRRTHRTSGASGADGTPKRVRRGLGNLEQIAGNFFSVARKYELQSFLRFALPQLNAGCQQAPSSPECATDPLSVSSRFSPVFGERLGAFGGFVFRGFREFDFGVGVYDALYLAAENDCRWEWNRDGMVVVPQDEQVRCVVRGVHAGYQRLRLDAPESAATAYVVRQLLRDEAQARLGSEAAAKKLLSKLSLKGENAHGWTISSPDSIPAYLPILLADARRVAKLKRPEKLEEELQGIQSVANKLKEPKVEVTLPEPDRKLLQESDWFASYSMRLLTRAEQVELEDEYPLGQRLTTGALFSLRTAYSLRRLGLDLDPSSVPDESGLGGVAHILPYHASFSTRTAQVGWRPTWGLTPVVGLVLPLSGSYRFNPESPYRWGAHAGVGVVTRFDNLLLTAVEASLRGTLVLESPDRRMLGAEFAVYGLAGKVRLGVVMDRFERIEHPIQQLYFTVGVSDLNGLLFHFVP